MGFVFYNPSEVMEEGELVRLFDAEWRTHSPREDQHMARSTKIPRAMDEIIHFDVEAEDHGVLNLMIGGNTIDVWRGSGKWAPLPGGVKVAKLFLQPITMTVTGGSAVVRMHCNIRCRTIMMCSDKKDVPTIIVTRGNRRVVLCLRGMVYVTPVPQDAPWSIATHATKFGADAAAVTGVAAAAAAVVPVEIAVPLLTRCFATDNLDTVIAQQYADIHF